MLSLLGGGGRAMIFIVDDDRAVRDSLGHLLAAEGLDSRSFGNPREFIESCRLSNDDRLIVDVDLPYMDGISLLQRLRAQGLTLWAVIITGQPSTFARQQALAAGAAAFLKKPVDADEIVSLLRDGKAATP